jgi:hypothetical protein
VRSIVPPFGPWEPAQPTEVAGLLSAMPCPWWIAGGYAIELAVGQPVRDHGDIDVVMLNQDQIHVQDALHGWEWWAGDPPGTLRPWQPGEHLRAGVHDVWCRPGPGEPWRIQVMIEKSDDGDWVSRRDPGIRRPLAGIGRTTSDGIRYLAPEIQLYYKAKDPRPKDEADFTAVLPFLTRPQQQWLTRTLASAFGDHPWRDRLATGDTGPDRHWLGLVRASTESSRAVARHHDGLRPKPNTALPRGGAVGAVLAQV